MISLHPCAALLPSGFSPQKRQGTAFASTNIALIKYWGKRDPILNLPLTSSLSVTVPCWGTQTTVSVAPQMRVTLNGQICNPEQPFVVRLKAYLDGLGIQEPLAVETRSNLPLGSGLASSASGFAALVLALDDLYGWLLPRETLSIVARVGSGSACRSLWPGLVHWHKGLRPDGLDSHGVPQDLNCAGISLGLLILDPSEKTISSRQGMHQTQATSPLMEAWCTWNDAQIPLILKSLTQGNWPETGERIEHNARVLHALIQSGWPPLSYTPAVTAEALAHVVRLRQEGVPVYATQDAGAQLILFFPDEAAERVRAVFPTLQIVSDILTSPAR